MVAFDSANAATEMPYFAQEIFDMAAKTKGVDDPDLQGAAREIADARGKDAIDTMLAKDAGATILVQPTYGPRLAERPGVRRPIYRAELVRTAGDFGLSQPDRADGAGARAAGRAVVHRAGL